MYTILANDGIDASCKKILAGAGIEVIEKKIAQEILAVELKKFDGIIVRSATKVTGDIIKAASHLKFIARAGVGLDNIDTGAAKQAGITVINTPGASSHSVAELVFAHLFGLVRSLHDSNRQMPLEGEKNFAGLKKKYSGGTELKGKTLGIIGLGRIGQAVAKIALGIGMKVIAHDPFVTEAVVEIEISGVPHNVVIKINTVPMEEALKKSDFITLHIPGSKSPVITSKEIGMMKDGAGIVNAARGGVVSESDLLDAIRKGKIAYAGLDVFENEPAPSLNILMEPNLSLTPHIGAATAEAQERIGIELGEKIVAFLKK
ncbi:MAG: D-2-hydroxyacid dehydrogenase [Bacteroidetes bacterium]|nr:D-2-hydroxyacid dehydrogenase [Bacteroidota bacterium]